MRKHNFFTRRASKYPQRQVITITDRGASKAFYQQTDADAPLEEGLFAVGIVQHPETLLYQVWVSTNGLDITCVSAHRNSVQASANKQVLKKLLSSDFSDDEQTTALFHEVCHNSDEKPAVLPDDLVREIGRSILRAVVC